MAESITISYATIEAAAAAVANAQGGRRRAPPIGNILLTLTPLRPAPYDEVMEDAEAALTAALAAQNNSLRKANHIEDQRWLPDELGWAERHAIRFADASPAS
ncbi:hypothetical protein SAMN04488144_14621 [Methylobacterium sp. 190mf]|uniref:hypothetical protein n=1 Tax=Methylobacterium sp. 190mf TaxID=1761798 RepID=UPI00089EE7E4|nr:hypothetical protein [Methylobacterium sp. 190mf]SEG70076.1 hypothetical protein SAMN04488144_14621 [Methylobacterium sp. 190mf]